MSIEEVKEVQEEAAEKVVTTAAEEAAEQEPQTLADAMFGDVGEDAPSSVHAGHLLADASPLALPPEGEGKTPEEEAAEQAAGEEPADDASEEMPEGLGKKAQDRFRALANENREYRQKEQEWREITESVQEVQGMIRESCNNTEEFLQLMDYGRAIKSGDWQTAEKHLREQVLQYEMMTGKPLRVEVLSEDLQAQVDSMALEEGTAREIAAARWQQQRLQQAQQAQMQQAQAQQQQAQAFEQTRQAAIAEVNRLSSEWAKSDLRWAEREDALVNFIRTELVQRHPSEWANGLRWYYEGLKKIGNTPAKVTPPLRAGTGQGGRAAPQSLADAMFGDLG